MLLLMLLNGEGKGVRFEVSGRTPVFIGRHALGLDKPDSRMSRQHAEIWHEDGAWLLRDLNATNGTFVNGNRVHDLCELEVGDHLRCGRTEFVIADVRPVAGDTHHDTRTHDLDNTAVLADPHGVALIDEAQQAELEPQEQQEDAAFAVVEDDDPDIQEDQGNELSLEPAARDDFHADDLDLDLNLDAPDDASSPPDPIEPVAVDEVDDDPDADLVSLSDEAHFTTPAAPEEPAADESLQLAPEAGAAPTAPEAPASEEPAGDADSNATLAPDEYAAEPAVVGLSLGHQPPPAPTEPQDQAPAPDEEPPVQDQTQDQDLADAPKTQEQASPVDEDVVSVPAGELADQAPAATEEHAALAPEAVETEADDEIQLENASPFAEDAAEAPLDPADDSDEYMLSADEIDAIQGLAQDDDNPAPAPAAHGRRDGEDEPAFEKAIDSADDADSPDNSSVPAVSDVEADGPHQAPQDDDDDVLKLGFQGAEPPTHHLDVDEPALRGQAPAEAGRFVVTETDDDLYGTDEHTDAADASASAERAALLGTQSDDAYDAADRWREPSRSRGPMGKGRQRLPLAVVGVAAIAVAGAALVYTATSMGWIGTPRVAGRTPETNAAATPSGQTDTTALASATSPNLDRGGAGSVFVDPSAMRRNSRTDTPKPASGDPQDTTVTETKPAPSTDTAPATNDTPSAIGQGATLPTLGAQPPAVTPAPRVATADQLQDLINKAAPDHTLGADDRRPGTTPSAPDRATPPAETTKVADQTADPEPETAVASDDATEPEAQAAAVDASEAFAWSGVSIGDPDSVFTSPSQGDRPTGTDIEQPADPTPAVDSRTTSPRLTPAPGSGMIRTTPRQPQGRPTTNPATSTGAVPAGPRRVAFLVDVSGTMVDSMPQLREHLATAIEELAPDQSFTVLLFRQNEAIELPPAGLRTATAPAKTAALDWLDADAQHIQLGGRSDPMPALQAALTHGVNEVVLLSDNALGRRVKPGGADLALTDLADALESHPGLKLHTVQFFYADDRALLENLAEQFDGEYEFVEPVTDANPDAPDVFGRSTSRR